MQNWTRVARIGRAEPQWLSRLMDYRLIHHAASALTHKSHPGNFQAFAIDIGCYAQFRKMEGRFSEIDVSDPAAKDNMRSAPVMDKQQLARTRPAPFLA
jgi:hypothetical protein